MATDTAISDGRSARSARTKKAVVRALLDLIGEGNLRPTARRVADRAGISLRSVYVHFDDLEELFVAAAREHARLVATLARRVSSDGSLATRVAAYAEQRCAVLEAIAPIRRAADLQEPFSPTLSRILDGARSDARCELAHVFAAELDQLDHAAGRRRLAALEAITSSAAWRVLRVANDLGADEARQALVEAITSLLSVKA